MFVLCVGYVGVLCACAMCVCVCYLRAVCLLCVHYVHAKSVPCACSVRGMCVLCACCVRAILLQQTALPKILSELGSGWDNLIAEHFSFGISPDRHQHKTCPSLQL